MKHRKKTSRVVFHHSLTDTDNVETIRRYHINHNGWQDIGYHYVITPDGDTATGREWSLVGAHAKGKNSDSIGVCLVGNFHKYEPPLPQLEAAKELFEDLCEEHGLLSIQFHRAKWLPNACPGPMLDRAEFKEVLLRGIV